MRKKCPFCDKERGRGKRPAQKAPCRTCVQRAEHDPEARRFLLVKYGIELAER